MTHCIYCAGPLFNPPEQREMAAIAAALEAAGFATFLPQRDGFELAHMPAALVKLGIEPARANALVNRAIFALDVSRVIDCDGALVNLNGRVPDEGAMIEVALAFAHGRALALYKHDARSLIDGMDNPMVTGLTDFTVHDAIAAAVADLRGQLADREPGPPELSALSTRVAETVTRGRRLFEALEANRANPDRVAQVLVDVLS